MAPKRSAPEAKPRAARGVISAGGEIALRWAEGGGMVRVVRVGDRDLDFL